MPREEWCCPRCGLNGDHMRTQDPTRCKQCCACDAAPDLLAALKETLVAMRALRGLAFQGSHKPYDAYPQKRAADSADAAAIVAIAKAEGRTP